MENNNIDNLFNEQLKNLEATPNKKIWNNIEAKLKKKKHRFLPFWWFSGGIAAIFVIGLLLFPFSKGTDTIKNNEEEIIITDSSEDKINLKNKINKIDTLFINKNNKKETIIIADKTNVKTQNKRQKNKTIKIVKEPLIAKTKNYKTEKKKELVSTKNAMKKIFLANNSTIIDVDSEKNKNVKIDKKSIKNNTEKEFTLKENKNFNKKEEIEKTDLNDFINKKELIKDKKLTQKKWSVAPVFAILNSNSFSDSSPIDKNLSNSTKGKNTFSYGIKVEYEINDKWSIQSGIHLQEMSYVNNNVIVTEESSSTSSSVIFSKQTVFSFLGNTSENINLITNSLTNIISSNGNLSQNYGYVEIPMELKYNFSKNKKFETQLIVGFSSLFLNKNEINLSTDEFSEKGNAKNLNNINFSGNLGLDFNYNFNKNWSLNLNPMFKTQLNTFTNSNGFQPFFIGIYTGIKYEF